MKIESISNGSLRVWLADEEIKEWGLAADEAASRRRVRRLVRQVLAAVGRRGTPHMQAEMIPITGGGVLLISPMVAPEAEQTAVYRIRDDNTLLSLTEQWRSVPEESQPHCSLYQREGGYDLVVYPDRSLSWRQMGLLLEYGEPLGCGEAIAARCGEYGTPVWSGAVLTGREPHPPVCEDRWN